MSSGSRMNNGSTAAVLGAAPVLTNGGGISGNDGSSVLDPSKPMLSVCVLSAYDLPVRDPPLHVSIAVGQSSGGTTPPTLFSTKIGPPLQRHKDRNSFKFPRQAVQLTAPSLPLLYQNTATVLVVYANASQTLSAEYKLNQLKLHETAWVILQLEKNNNNHHPDDPEEEENDHDDNNNDMATPPPTLRLQWTLHGPYRAEVGFIVNLFESWFHFVDAAEDKLFHNAMIRSLPNAKFLWIAAAPILAALVVTAPILAGVAVVTLPVAVPILALLLGLLGSLVALGAFGYASTKNGRTSISSLLGPAVQTIIATRAGQTALYQTGPRPTPVTLCRAILPHGLVSKLMVCLLIDAIGSASYLIPVVGEITDLGWAPIQTILLMAMYENTNNNKDLDWLKYVSFMEEILPFTDIVPTATFGWFIQCGIPHWFGKDVAKTLTNVLSTVAPSANNNNNNRAAPRL